MSRRPRELDESEIITWLIFRFTADSRNGVPLRHEHESHQKTVCTENGIGEDKR